MKYKLKRFSAVGTTIVRKNKILGTSGNRSLGFNSSRNYDMDMNRFGRMGTAQRELSKPNEFNKELRKLSKELYKQGDN